MKVGKVRVPYPKEKLSELEKYKERLLEEDRPEEQRPSEDVYEEETIEKKILQIKRREPVSPILKKLMVSEQQPDIAPLKTIGANVVGSLFDRVKFLKERINECKVFIEDRKSMNEQFNKEIDSDIADMENIIPSIAEREELREFKINLNLLNMEKRKENNLFWRDMVELKTQLRELSEQFEVESKISSLFSDLDTI